LPEPLPDPFPDRDPFPPSPFPNLDLLPPLPLLELDPFFDLATFLPFPFFLFPLMFFLLLTGGQEIGVGLYDVGAFWREGESVGGAVMAGATVG
jgi:hypothetical protein